MSNRYLYPNFSKDTPIDRIIQKNLLTCRPDTSIQQAANLMAQRQSSSIVVIKDKKAVGIWTEHDSLRLDLNDPSFLFKPIKEVMSKPVKTLPYHTTIGVVQNCMHELQIRHILITDEKEKPLGIVSTTDLSLNQGFESYLHIKTIKEIMATNPLIINGNLSLSALIPIMRTQDVELAVVREDMHDSSNDGVISERDLIKYIAVNDISSSINRLATRPVYHLAPNDSLWKARNLFITKKIRHIVIKEGDEVIGTLSHKQVIYGYEGAINEDDCDILKAYEKRFTDFSLDINLTRQIINNSLESILITDKDNTIQFVNPAFTHITGYFPEEVIGKKVSILSSGRHNLKFYQKMWRKIKEHGFWKGEIWNRKKNGQLYLELLKITAIYDTNGEVINYLGTCSDITYIRENERKIERLAFYDPLTTLPNRRLFENQITEAIKSSQRLNKQLAVIYLDLDHFKSINDTLGHEAGDKLLIILTNRIKLALRTTDILARIGGDEFVILLHDIKQIDSVELVCQRISKKLNEAVKLNEHTLRVGCSLGVSIFPEHGQTATELLRNADIAMYRAKAEGRNTYALYQAQMQLPQSRFLALNTAFREAVETTEELYFVYQPIVNFDGQMTFVEALARWKHPELGDISPLEFIQLAERTGLIKDFSAISCQLLISQISKWLDKGFALKPVSINISPLQFWDQGFTDSFLEFLHKKKIPTNLFKIELTEGVILSHHQKAIEKLNTLHDNGIKIYIDDFGTGYSSLSYLDKLPISGIKIDQQFIKNMSTNKASRAILAAVASLAKELGVLSVAEGVETEEQFKTLQSFGIDLMQGYYIDKPLSSEEFEKKWLKIK